MGSFFFEVGPIHVDSFRFFDHLCPELIESPRISVKVPTFINATRRPSAVDNGLCCSVLPSLIYSPARIHFASDWWHVNPFLSQTHPHLFWNPIHFRCLSFLHSWLRYSSVPYSCRFVVLNHHSAFHQDQICDSLHSAAYQNIPSIFPRSYPGPLKVRDVLPLSDCPWWNPWPFLSEISFFHTPVFPSPRTTRSLLAPWLCYCFRCLLVCLPVALCLTDVSHIFIASFLALITSCTLSFHHHVSLSPGDLRPAVMLNTSCPTIKIVVLLCSHRPVHYPLVFLSSTPSP